MIKNAFGLTRKEKSAFVKAYKRYFANQCICTLKNYTSEQSRKIIKANAGLYANKMVRDVTTGKSIAFINLEEGVVTAFITGHTSLEGVAYMSHIYCEDYSSPVRELELLQAFRQFALELSIKGMDTIATSIDEMNKELAGVLKSLEFQEAGMHNGETEYKRKL